MVCFVVCRVSKNKTNKSKSFDFYTTSDYIFVKIQSNSRCIFWVRKDNLRNWLLSVCGELVCTEFCVTSVETTELRLFCTHSIPLPRTILNKPMWLKFLSDWHSRWCTLGWNSCYTNDFTITSGPAYQSLYCWND